MAKNNDDLVSRLNATFRAEAGDHVRALNAGLTSLAQATPAQQPGIVETAFREAHSLKGAARTVGAGDVEAAAHAMESAFSTLKKGEGQCSIGLLDVLHQMVDTIAGLVGAGEREPSPELTARIRKLTQAIGEAFRGVPPTTAGQYQPSAGEFPPHPHDTASVTPPGPHVPETVRIQTRRIEALLRQSEEIQAASLTLGTCPEHLQEAAAEAARLRAEWARLAPQVRNLRKTAERNPSLKPVLEFLDGWASAAGARGDRLASLARIARREQRALESLAHRMAADLGQVLLLPLSALLESFPRMVRDLARESGKQADLEISGEDVEMDRRVLETLKDPLIHLVRNCIDHGIEPPDERQRLGKPRRARISVRSSRLESGHAEISVTDDGAGIDWDKVRAAAVKLGLVGEEQGGTGENGSLRVAIFESGLSTSPIITSISGRGLGLAIVREKVQQMGGTLVLETEPGRGTTFRIGVPVGLATFRAIFVKSGGQILAIPDTGVERVVRIDKDAVRTVEDAEALEVGGRVLALVSLAEALGLSASDGGEGRREEYAVIMADEETRVALAVEEVLFLKEVLLKDFGPALAEVRVARGAIVTPAGQVVPVLHPQQLLRSAARGSRRAPKSESARKETPSRRPRVLVAEDSITSRVLLRNILEAAGFEVLVAVDGIDALTTLKAEPVALLVSDVDMPRMNGFDLTARIRADAKLAGLPVVLVTALDSREDREQGIDVGANAYIVKSGFDQSNLLDVVHRLI